MKDLLLNVGSGGGAAAAPVAGGGAAAAGGSAEEAPKEEEKEEGKIHAHKIMVVDGMLTTQQKRRNQTRIWASVYSIKRLLTRRAIYRRSWPHSSNALRCYMAKLDTSYLERASPAPTRISLES